MNQGAWRATVHRGHKELDMTEWLNMYAHNLTDRTLFLDTKESGILPLLNKE